MNDYIGGVRYQASFAPDISGERETWRDSASCLSVDAELFFPEKGRAGKDAVRICRGCPVRQQCLAWAMKHRPVGVWGATTEKQRQRIRAAA